MYAHNKHIYTICVYGNGRDDLRSVVVFDGDRWRKISQAIDDEFETTGAARLRDNIPVGFNRPTRAHRRDTPRRVQCLCIHIIHCGGGGSSVYDVCATHTHDTVSVEKNSAMIDARTTLEPRADLTETNADDRPSAPALQPNVHFRRKTYSGIDISVFHASPSDVH